MLKYTQKEFDKLLKDTLVSECGVTLDVASENQIYRCLATIVRQIMSDQQKKFQARAMGEGKKQVYYLCMEFLMGRSLRTSLFNLGLQDVARDVLADADIKIDNIYAQEPERGPRQRRPGPPGRLLSRRYGHRLHPRHRLLHPV